MNKQTILFFWSIVFVFGLYYEAMAQADTTKNNVGGGFLIMPLEFPVIDKTALNQQLQHFGFPTANNPVANPGIGFQLYGNRFITTFSFNKSTRKRSEDTYTTEVEYRSTSLNLGYDLTRSQWYSVYPYIGFKGCGLNYLYRDIIPDKTTLHNYMQTDLRYKEVTNSRAHADLGIGLSHQWFYLINFRFGYLLPLEKVRWNMNNNQTSLADSPAVSYNYYFTLTLGFGNIVSDNQLRQHYNRP